MFCQADLVPVGNDQIPVIEITRKIVRRFNGLYKSVLKEPETLLSKCPRLMGLDGNAKMGKSLNNAVYLSDTDEVVRKKVSKALTDTGRVLLKDKGDPNNCVVNKYHEIFSKNDYDDICDRCKNASIGCSACKQHLINNINALLEPFREKRNKYENMPGYVDEVLQHGISKAKQQGAITLEIVKDAMQISYFK